MNPRQKEILRVENELTQKYRSLWDSPNVYTKHIGQEKGGFLRQVYCIFQLNRMSREIVKQEHVAI